ncbi:hypothetical protein H5U98_15145 [Mycolicibacterium boenickei]|uniref:Glycoside hydrolase n=1 Tax=Mycolicibacterium boenickei TaxID=146017 RepID=A0AAX3A4H3_9MYCO|nr:hypothetical protein [Mycolicibacterium boenickei]PEG57930.1 hypothetical protein CQY21_25130 [Mycolicibacterium boenickei]UNC02583.1 hypothetical protein H5U98_15145 [Mycolicibacterium boenickei]BBX92612.1 hypothetical protein MBOE_42610 [Mycolicibacterium boenickei]
MPGVDRLMETFGKPKHVKKIISSVLVASGLGGATLLSSPVHQHPSVAVQPQPATDSAPRTVAAPPPAAAPVIVTKDSSAQDIVKAIVSQGRAAKLSEDQIKTVIATAKIESSFRPAASGGVQAYGGPGGAADEVIGLFQEKASFGTVADRQDPNKSIARFIARFSDAFKKYRITSGDAVLAATLAQNPQLLKYHGGVGTQYYNTVKSAMSAAADLYRAAGTSLQPVT